MKPIDECHRSALRMSSMRCALAAGLGIVFLLSFALPTSGEDNKLPDIANVVLDNTSQITLYSLEPKETEEKDNALHGWKVLGKTTIKDTETREKILSALAKNIAASGIDGAKCFHPRHAIQATYDDNTVDLMICFECHWVYVYINGEEVARVVTDSLAELVFDEVLQKAEVPLEKKPKP